MNERPVCRRCRGALRSSRLHHPRRRRRHRRRHVLGRPAPSVAFRPRASEARTVADFTGIELRGCADARDHPERRRIRPTTTCSSTSAPGGASRDLDGSRRYRSRALTIESDAGARCAPPGSGDVQLADSTARLTIAISPGDVDRPHRVARVAISGFSDVDLSAVKAKAARAQISGLATSRRRHERLDATISLGDVRYTFAASALAGQVGLRQPPLSVSARRRFSARQAAPAHRLALRSSSRRRRARRAGHPADRAAARHFG